jgi:NET1-associated nuclear protein 1 (U3 small nucleolar RNA-associated protein 17)
MILSTAELTPTANIAGVQAHVIEPSRSFESFVKRVEEESHSHPHIQKAPAVISPLNPSQLLLAVGETQKINPQDTKVLSAPFLQVYDIATSHSVLRQAMSRTNITNKNIAPNAHRLTEPRVTHMQISSDGLWLATVDEWVLPKDDINFLKHGGMDIDDERQSRREIFLKFWQWSPTGNIWELVSRVDSPHGTASDESAAGRVLDLTAAVDTLEFSTVGEDGIVRIWAPKTRKRDGVVVRDQDGKALRNWSCHSSVALGKPEADDESNSKVKNPSTACVAFSEDSSVLAAAVGGFGNGLVHLIDPSNGTVRHIRTGMYKGDLLRLAFLGKYLITVSDEIRVYDMVLDEVTWGITLKNLGTILTAQQKLEMIHLAVDRSAKTFAVALPCKEDWQVGSKKVANSMYGAYSEIAIFEPSQPAPVHTSVLSTMVTALLPATGSQGYVVLDTCADIRTLHPGTTQATNLSTTALPETTEVAVPEEPVADIMQLVPDDEEMGDETEAVTPAADADEDDGPPVVTQQQLSSIFDVGPAFALPPIEEMFYQVAGLFSSKINA